MSSEKNNEKIPEKNNDKITNNDPEIITTKKKEKSPNIKANIEMQKEGKNKKRNKIKIRAYCNKCYQFFENGPYTKICRNHLEKDCNLIKCQKFKQNGDSPCIRKFPNINSANRHTHCLTQKDIEIWDPKCEIQKCLGKKKESDNKFSDIINDGNENNDKNSNINKIEKKNNNNTSISKISNSFLNEINNSNSFLNMNLNLNNNLFLSNNSFLDNNNSNCFNNNNNNVIELIEDIEKFHFNENDNKNTINNNFDVRLIEDIEKIHFNENDNISNNNDCEIKNIFSKTNSDDKDEKQNNIIEEISKNEEIKDKVKDNDKNKEKDNNKNKDIDKSKEKDKNKEVKEENKGKEKDKEEKEENKTSALENIEKIENESIEDFFEKVQKETNIPNNVKKKLVNAFKKKGIFNVKILLLFYEKHKNWDFLIEKFKNISSQIEGVALCIEFLLNLH